MDVEGNGRQVETESAAAAQPKAELDYRYAIKPVVARDGDQSRV
jgi:hypothetical protein